jgi:hypothetical protein
LGSRPQLIFAFAQAFVFGIYIEQSRSIPFTWEISEIYKDMVLKRLPNTHGQDLSYAKSIRGGETGLGSPQI